ncbi:hypothetical protein Q8F55_008458 [Vanrija albida]|uniref:Major facilitator superfamily (MFS) profile domain-containing protein n=1 Tax=Vanrija albida TaxID=181172 RepID=A0ABR3PQW6_9TREE
MATATLGHDDAWRADEKNIQGTGARDGSEKSAVDVAAPDTGSSIDLGQELIDTSKIDIVLTKKMALINKTIDEIGMTPLHWKLFALNGFGYAADSLLVSCQYITQRSVIQEFGNPNPPLQGVSLASQIGLLAGAALWGFSADIIGRRLAFNSSLFVCAIFVLLTGAMPNYISFCAFIAIYSAGAGGNYILDATNFIEFLPVSHSFLVTLLAAWWGIGYIITGFFAWWYMSDYSCQPKAAECHRKDNMGWRYLHFTAGAICTVLALIRVFAIKMPHTPKYLISNNRDEEVFEDLQAQALKYNRPFTLTLEQLRGLGEIKNAQKSRWSLTRIKHHFVDLFRTLKLAYSTVMIMLNWFFIGTVSPLYGVFLPYYLSSRNADLGGNNNYYTWRDYAINQVMGFIGPCLAAFLVEYKWLGRRGTLAVSAAATTALQIGYTQITTPSQNLGISCAISIVSNIYYGVLYAYTPEILPAANRGTGYALCVIVNRIGGIIGVIVGSYANVTTVTPLWVCAGLYGALIFTSLALPFESRGKRTV